MLISLAKNANFIFMNSENACIFNLKIKNGAIVISANFLYLFLCFPCLHSLCISLSSLLYLMVWILFLIVVFVFLISYFLFRFS